MAFNVPTYINNQYSVSSDTASSLNRLGTKQYEFSDHLGNVLVTILDKRSGIGNAGGNYTGWLANVSAVNDYYPFGMLMEERSAGIGGRYSFNGMEQDNEVKGTGNSLDFGARMYDSRIARFLSLDPDKQKYPYQSPYIYGNNSPTQAVDEEGKGVIHYVLKNLAKIYKGTVAVGTSISVSFGAGISGFAGMGVNYKGNVAILYGGALGKLEGATFNFKNVDKLKPNANLNITSSILPFKDVKAISGLGYTIGGSFYTPKTVGGGASADFSYDDKGHVSFQGFTTSSGVGTPGGDIELGGLQITNAVLFSQSDFQTLFETDWDKLGMKMSNELNSKTSNHYRSPPDGHYQYNSTEFIFKKIDGYPNAFSVIIKQNFYFSTTGQGAAKGRRDRAISTYVETGIIMERKNDFTVQSTNLQ